MPDPVSPVPGAAGGPPPPPPANDKVDQSPKASETGAKVDPVLGKSTAEGKETSDLGGQVHPATMLNEADGNRTLMNPVTDPGPVQREGGLNLKHPDRLKGEKTFADANPEGLQVRMRTSTGHGDGFARPAGEHVEDVKLPPDLGINYAASDVYNKERGKSLTDMAEKHAAQPREVAPATE